MVFNLTEKDSAFILKAENLKLNISKLNLSSTDFTSTTFKNAIQYLIKKHHFEKNNIQFQNTFNLQNLKTTANALCDSNKNSYKEVFDFTMNNKFGQGEVIIYFLVNDAILSGPSKDFDVTSGSKNIEVKGVKPISYTYKNTKMNVVTDFRLGGTINFIDEIQKMQSLYVRAVSPDNEKKNGVLKNKPIDYKSGMGNQVFQYIQRSFPVEYEEVEKSFRKKAMRYFSQKSVVFFNNKPNAPDYGQILNSKNIEEKDVYMYRFIGQGMTLSPFIKL